MGCLHRTARLKVQSARNSCFCGLGVNQSDIEVERILLVSRELTGPAGLRAGVRDEPLCGRMALAAQTSLHHTQRAENHLLQVLGYKGKIM